MNGKRAFDLVFAVLAIIVASPVLVVVALWVKLDSPGPVFFSQKRVGLRGEPFNILKFRTMQDSQTKGGLAITATGDSRITRSGTVLRKLKLDELPQFFNVLLGQMSVVGPRPEVEKYVDLYPEPLRDSILSVRPGLTDSAAIVFRNESDLLAQADDPEKVYVDEILPTKLTLYEEYIRRQSVWRDVVIIFRTAVAVFRH